MGIAKARDINEMSTEELADVLIRRPDWADAICKIADVSKLQGILQKKLIPLDQIHYDWNLEHNLNIRKALQSISGHLMGDPNYQIWEQTWDKYSKDLDSLQKNCQSFRVSIEHYFAEGLSPQELSKICEEQGYNLAELYRGTALTDEYKKYGYKYDSNSKTISPIEEIRAQIESEEELERFYIDNPDFDDRPDSLIPEGISSEEYEEIAGAYINEFGEIVRQERQKISLLQHMETTLSSLEEEEKTISETEKLIDKQTEKEGQDIGEE